MARVLGRAGLRSASHKQVGRPPAFPSRSSASALFPARCGQDEVVAITARDDLGQHSHSFSCVHSAAFPEGHPPGELMALLPLEETEVCAPSLLFSLLCRRGFCLSHPVTVRPFSRVRGKSQKSRLSLPLCALSPVGGEGGGLVLRFCPLPQPWTLAVAQQPGVSLLTPPVLGL